VQRGGDIQVHFGQPIDFAQQVAECQRKNNLVFDDIGTPDAYCGPKQDLYRGIMADVRKGMLHCHKMCVESQGLGNVG